MPRRAPRRSLRGLAAWSAALALALEPAHARAAPDPGVLTAAGQARRDAGDVAGAIDRWQRALAAVPVTQATAHRRAGLVLAIAAAHAERGDVGAALEVLDGYLAGLDPTDDENRVAVEQRRAALAAARVEVRGPADAVDDEPGGASDRRLWVAGGTVLGLGVVGVAMLGLGLGLGRRADRDLQAAVGLAGDDPQREAAKAAALDRGGRANDAALAGGVIGGVLLVTGVALVIAAATRQARARRGQRALRVVPTGAGLLLRF